jgi:CheY-like chemotaxis protein
VKFTETGSIVLRIRYTQAPQALDQPGSLSVEVEDTGRGIAEDEIGRLFQPFTQTESGRAMQQGTGLGLAITRQFVQILGGNISVKSRIGLGTTFAFTIPVKPGVPPTTLKSVSQRRVVGLAPGQMSHRILVVDDAEENRLLLCKLLQSVGFEVRDTANGKDAVELHEAWHPHLIFMDMKMPVMDGYEATRRIKASTQGQATAIIALTASALEETHSMALSAGCDDYLRKPLVMSELLTKIEQHLGVQFLFEVDETGESGSSARHAEEIVLTRADLLDLPEAWISNLHALAVMADSNRMLKKIEEIQDEHPRLAKTLTNLVKTFHLETILALTSMPMAQENDDAPSGCQS